MMKKTKQMITRTYCQNQKRKKKSKVKHINKWKHSDLPVIDDFECNLPILGLNSYEPTSSLLEKLLTNDILEFICNESDMPKTKETIPTRFICMI